jgi:hypothetical protein
MNDGEGMKAGADRESNGPTGEAWENPAAGPPVR